MNSARATFTSLHVRNFRLFFIGQLLSQCGTWMQTIALGWLILHLSHNSGFAVGLALALQFIPTLLFGVWGGMIADRFDKRTVLICTQVAMAAIAVVLAVLDFTNVVQLEMIYVIVFLFGLALAVDNPTRQSFVPGARPARRPPQRDRPEQRHLPAVAHPRPRARRRVDRRRRHRDLLRAERGVVRLHHRRADDDAPERAAPRRAGSARAGSDP